MKIILVLVLVLAFSLAVAGQTTAFTYQGRLTDASLPANGTVEMRFKLYDALTVGTQQPQPTPITLDFTVANGNAVTVANGIFTVQLDFTAAAFPGSDRFLEISVRHNDTESFTLLNPRKKLNSSPYSIRTTSAGSADSLSANCAGCVTDAMVSDTVTVGPAGTVDNAALPASVMRTTGATMTGPLDMGNNLITNIGGAGTDFTAGGGLTTNGTVQASIVRAGSQFNMGAERVLRASCTDNTFLGIGAGEVNIECAAGGGNKNSFFGANAGKSNTGNGGPGGLQHNSFFGANSGDVNTTGFQNSFFGSDSGGANTTGDDNSFFGFEAGKANTTSNNNSFFGSGSGLLNTTGAANSFFGLGSGGENVDGSDNSFFGVNAGRGNTSGLRNSFFGRLAGRQTTTGNDNTGVGYQAGDNNTTGSNLTMIGADANVSSSTGLTFATAIGAGSRVGTSNTIALGRTSGLDTVRIYGNLLVDGTCTGCLSFSGTEKIDAELVRKQQAQIESQQKLLEGQQRYIRDQKERDDRQQQQIDALKKLVCLQNPQAAICKEEK